MAVISYNEVDDFHQYTSLPEWMMPYPVPTASHILGRSNEGPIMPNTSGLYVIGPATTLAMFASASTGMRSIAAATLSLILSRSLSNNSFPKPGGTPSHLQYFKKIVHELKKGQGVKNQGSHLRTKVIIITSLVLNFAGM